MLDLLHCFCFVSSCRTLAKYTDDLYDVYTQSFPVTPPSALYLYLNVLLFMFSFVLFVRPKRLCIIFTLSLSMSYSRALSINHIPSQTTPFTKKQPPKPQSHLQSNHTSHLPIPPQPSHKIPNIPKRNIPRRNYPPSHRNTTSCLTT